jgi:ATP-binding cassette subfamily F protein 3
MITITDLSARIAGRLLLDHASVTLPAGVKAGLVGRNGAGKSTLFRVITGDFSAESGSVTIPKMARIGQVAQEAPGTEESLISIVLSADKERCALLAEAETATDPHRIAEIQMRLVDIDAHSAEARASSILAGLGFNHEAQLRPASSFSGGWRMRVALASVLFAEPDLLLLDEPTNYLDLEGTLWLEDYIRRYPHTVIIISHDRDLLNNAVNSIVHLDQKKLTFYRGGYDQFERQKAEADELQMKAKVKNDAARKHLQSFIDRFRAKATKARQAQSRIKALERMGTVAAVIEDHVQPITFPEPERQPASPIVAIQGGAVGYEPGKPILKNITLRIDNDDRIALLGSNGNGKSTLVKLLANKLPPFSGRITRAEKLSVGYFAQHQVDELDLEASTYDHIRRLMPDAPESKVRARAGAIGFSGKAADTLVKSLSGGEKARLLLGLATFFGPNMIILDEPTNHLDIDSRAALAEAINEFPGAVIMVSHHRFLIESFAYRLWVVADRTVTAYDGDLEDYRRMVLSANGVRTTREREVSEREKPQRARGEKRAPSRQQISSAEAEIARITGIIEKIDAALALPDIFTRDPKQAAQLAKARSAAADALHRAEEAWLEASALLEQAG